MNLPHRHIWTSFHPTGYQKDVLMFQCACCPKIYHQGVRGEHGQVIPLGVSATTGQVLFGGAAA